MHFLASLPAVELSAYRVEKAGYIAGEWNPTINVVIDVFGNVNVIIGD